MLPRLDVQHSPTGSVVAVRLLGNHDIATAHDVRRALLDAGVARLVVIDVAACTFLDSTVIGVLVSHSKSCRARGALMVIINAHGVVARAVGAVRLEQVIPTFPLDPGGPADDDWSLSEAFSDDVRRAI